MAASVRRSHTGQKIVEPLGKGLMGTLISYPYEVRDEKEYFDDIQDVKVTKDSRRVLFREANPGRRGLRCRAWRRTAGTQAYATY